MKKSLSQTFGICLSAAFLITACASAPAPQPKEPERQEEQEQVKAPQTPRKLNVVNSSVSASTEETPESLYAKKIQDITLSVHSYPNETVKGKAFSAPFSFKAVKSDGTPASGLELSITYPETKINGQLGFALANLTTDSNGTVTFIPATPSYSFNSEIRAYPSGDITNPEIQKLAEKAAVKAPYKVRTNRADKGGTISLLDFNSSGKPVLNDSSSSSSLLMCLMRKGFTRIGNADFSASILTDDVSNVYKVAKALVGNNSSYLIFGKVTYLSPAEKNAEGKYSLTLEGNVTCLDMKDGSVLCQIKTTGSSTESTQSACIVAARKALAENLAQEINYGL